VAVTLSFTPALEERVIDWLLTRDDVVTFAAYAVHLHGAGHEELSVAEQVSGRQRRVEVRVELPAATLDGWLEALVASFGGADIHYAVTPLVRAGRLRDLPPSAASS
jgi:hypothetical protein